MTDLAASRPSTEQLIGRSDVDDLAEILAVANNDVDSVMHIVKNNADAIFTWDYQPDDRPGLMRLYEKAKKNQWNATTDVDWSIEVDPEQVAVETSIANAGIFSGETDLSATPLAKFSEADWLRFGVESQNWTLSQFLHGEQGALICTAKIVETVPWIDAKYYGSTQVFDEARHVEVFGTYLDEKLDGHYPVNAHLSLLLDEIVNDSRWDMTYLGMQIMVEGLALAAFGFIRQLTTEPLLKQILKLVMSDEARHVAFGILSLKDYYTELNQAEIRERQEFAFEAAVRMRDRFLQQEVWERMGVPVADTLELVMNSPERAAFQQMLFTKIVPNCSKLGLLDAGDGWLRTKFGELGVLQFEHWADTESEYDDFALDASDLAGVPSTT